jgi:hypothetical protein
MKREVTVLYFTQTDKFMAPETYNKLGISRVKPLIKLYKLKKPVVPPHRPVGICIAYDNT